MSFWGKVKQWLGIGGVKLELQIPSTVGKKDTQIQGQLHITSKSDQIVKEIKIIVEEEWQTGRGEEKTRKTFQLGTIKLPGFEIKTGESKSVEFTVPFELIKSNNDELKEKGGALGALGKLGAFAGGEKSDFFVKADADVQGTAFGPGDRKPIRLTE